MGHEGISSEISRRPLSNDIKFARIGVRTRELWLPEVGVSELFLCTFPMKIPVKRGMLSANREFHVVAGVIIFPTHPGLADQLVASRKDSAREGGCPGGKNAFCSQRVFSQILSQFARVFDLVPDVGFRRSWYRRKACVAYFCKVPGFAEIRAWTCEIWPREQRPPEVFLVRLRAVFRSGIPARPRFDHNSLVSRPFSTRKVSNRSSHNVFFRMVKEQVSSIQLSVWSTVRSNLGQLGLGRVWSKPSKLGLGNVSRIFFLGSFDVDEPSSDQAGSASGCPRFACQHPRKSRRFVSVYVPALSWSKWAFQGLEKIGRDAKRRTLIDDQSSPIRPRGKHLSIPTFLFSFERSD
uniref:Uncharacterized protein n=1 Tax=Fagus sylvatica TaxID=28930 RepID=A0A2N9FF18_FAGSY